MAKMALLPVSSMEGWIQLSAFTSELNFMSTQYQTPSNEQAVSHQDNRNTSW